MESIIILFYYMHFEKEIMWCHRWKACVMFMAKVAHHKERARSDSRDFDLENWTRKWRSVPSVNEYKSMEGGYWNNSDHVDTKINSLESYARNKYNNEIRYLVTSYSDRTQLER